MSTACGSSRSSRRPSRSTPPRSTVTDGTQERGLHPESNASASDKIYAPFSDDGPILRLYPTHAKIFLDNVQAEPAVIGRGGRFERMQLQILSKDSESITESTKSAVALVLRARALGIPAFAAFRLNPHSKDKRELLDADAWRGRAELLRFLLEKTRDAKTGKHRIGFDVEAYISDVTYDEQTLTTLGSSPRAFEALMQPFLEELRRHDPLVAIYPIVRTCHMTDNIFRTVSRGEAWEEKSFGTTLRKLQSYDDYRESILRLSEVKGKNRRKWPHVATRAGLRDDYLRHWGKTMRDESFALGGLSPWVFRYLRADSEVIGSPRWRSGLSLDSRNDVASAWHKTAKEPLADQVGTHQLALFCDKPVELKRYGHCKKSGHRLPLSAERRSAIDGRIFYATPRLPASNARTIYFSADLPTVLGPSLGLAAMWRSRNKTQMSLLLLRGTFHVVIGGASKPRVVNTKIRAVPGESIGIGMSHTDRGVDLIIVRDGKAPIHWHAKAQIDATETTLRIGAAVDQNGRWSNFTGAQLHPATTAWTRALTKEEWKRMAVGHGWPFGRR